MPGGPIVHRKRLLGSTGTQYVAKRWSNAGSKGQCRGARRNHHQPARVMWASPSAPRGSWAEHGVSLSSISRCCNPALRSGTPVHGATTRPPLGLLGARRLHGGSSCPSSSSAMSSHQGRLYYSSLHELFRTRPELVVARKTARAVVRRLIGMLSDGGSAATGG